MCTIPCQGKCVELQHCDVCWKSKTSQRINIVDQYYIRLQWYKAVGYKKKCCTYYTVEWSSVAI